jgi:hypothetical protein
MSKCVECGASKCNDIDGACHFCGHEMIVRCSKCKADFCKYCVAEDSDDELEDGELPVIEISEDEYEPTKRPRRQAAVKASKFIKLVSAAVALAGGFKGDSQGSSTEPESEDDIDISEEASDNDEPITQEEEEPDTETDEDEEGSVSSEEEEDEVDDE